MCHPAEVRQGHLTTPLGSRRTTLAAYVGRRTEGPVRWVSETPVRNVFSVHEFAKLPLFAVRYFPNTTNTQHVRASIGARNSRSLTHDVISVRFP